MEKRTENKRKETKIKLNIDIEENSSRLSRFRFLLFIWLL